ncbi:helix-turn-helix domain-containing protein [Streptomyces sp. Amel2xC10]|uniref:helix-turn-helix domain-containing protein n=1 Tax=Streptomyces sp. Amel2xC10 TaxID=1305826 RepID=UPI000A087D40|nr:helix-turn-helix transcriptional regulator [Streptomyces sp. Amel2xC10]SMF87263.1 Predicted transcriptional regulators [Streptomyces sp. Amel2xC10]
MPRDRPDWIAEHCRTLGDRVADLRTAAHYTQETFSEATGISRSTIQRIESGEGDARYSELLRIAAVLDTTVSVLID